jgi:hypothetical protein
MYIYTTCFLKGRELEFVHIFPLQYNQLSLLPDASLYLSLLTYTYKGTKLRWKIRSGPSIHPHQTVHNDLFSPPISPVPSHLPTARSPIFSGTRPAPNSAAANYGPLNNRFRQLLLPPAYHNRLRSELTILRAPVLGYIPATRTTPRIYSGEAGGRHKFRFLRQVLRHDPLHNLKVCGHKTRRARA